MDVENEGDNQDSRSPTDEMQTNQPTVSQQQALSEQSISVRMLNTNKEPISYAQQILESLMGRISESSNEYDEDERAERKMEEYASRMSPKRPQQLKTRIRSRYVS